MTSQLNYLIARQRQVELAYRAEQARLAGEARATRPAFPARRYVRRLRATQGSRAPHPAAAAENATAVSLQPELRCNP
jgi:hypothetical protein